jgi:carbon monoxide dehydrogenase subunit G
MRLENSFEVPASPDTVWALLMDVPRVIPCMPGAKLDEELDATTWKATMNVKLGPIALTFATDVKREEADTAARRTKLAAKAREARGRGNAQATIESSLTSQNGGTRVDIVTDLALSGAVAQYGRGIVVDVSSQLVKQFADCLKAQLATPEEARAAVAAQARPVSGLRLGAVALWRAFVRLFRRR